MDMQEQRDMCVSVVGATLWAQSLPQYPLNMTNPPKQVWHTVYVDYCCPFLSGRYLFVAVDETSKYPEVHITQPRTTATAIKLLNKIFATHRIPEVISSGNVPFESGEFTAWCNRQCP